MGKSRRLCRRIFSIFEDVDYCMRFKECGVNILYVPKVALWHKLGGSAGEEISAVSLYYTVRNRLVFADKYQQYFKSDIKGKSLDNRGRRK